MVGEAANGPTWSRYPPSQKVPAGKDKDTGDGRKGR